MALVTTALLAAKGIAFWIKAHAAHAAIAKAGAHLLAAKGLAATAATATTIATGTGIVLVARSKIMKSSEAFCILRDGLTENNSSKILDAVFKLHDVYSSVSDLKDDFSTFINGFGYDDTIKDCLKEGVNQLTSFLQAELENKTVNLVAEIEEYLKSRNSSLEKYEKNIMCLYQTNFNKNVCTTYREVLNQAGMLYDSIRKYNMTLGVGPEYNQYDHYLVYCIAGWIKENIHISEVKSKSQKVIAQNITDDILKFLNGK